MPRPLFPIALLGAALLASGCSQPPQLHVDKAYVRLAAVAKNPSAAYFTVHGGPTDSVLVDVTCPDAIRSEMHESVMTGSMASMKPIRDIPVPAKQTVAFAPGGRHLMLFDVDPHAKPGTTVPLDFVFGNGTQIEVTAKVIGAGDPVPKN